MSIQVNITGGVVSVEDGIPAKTGDFDPKRKVKVELSFTVPENTETQPILTAVAKMAHDQVLTLLGKAPKAEVVVTQAAAVIPAGDAPKETAAQKKAREKAEAAANKPTDKTKADLAKEAGLPTTSTQHKGTTPALVDELDETPAPKAEAPKSADDDVLGDLLGDSAPKVVSDQELGKAAQEKNGKMKGVAGWAPEKIRALVGEFVQEDGKPKPGAKIADVPQAQRQAFLTKLEALK